LRWKPRCTGGCKCWALISSLQESISWCIANANVSVTQMMTLGNRELVRYAFFFWTSMSK
jgi:hypothetical protein